MKIAGLQNKTMDVLRDMVSDVLDAPRNDRFSTNPNASSPLENSINNIEDPAKLAHQVLGNKMTQVDMIV